MDEPSEPHEPTDPKTPSSWFDILDSLSKHRKNVKNKPNYLLLRKGYKSDNGMFGTLVYLFQNFIEKLFERKKNKDLYVLVSSNDWSLSNGQTLINYLFRDFIRNNKLHVDELVTPPKNWMLKFSSKISKIGGSISILYLEDIWKDVAGLDKSAIYYVYISSSYSVDMFFSDALLSNVFSEVKVPRIFIVKMKTEDVCFGSQVVEKGLKMRGWVYDYFVVPCFTVNMVYDLRKLHLQKFFTEDVKENGWKVWKDVLHCKTWRDIADL